MKKIVILGLTAFIFAAYALAKNQARNPYQPTQRVSLSNGFSIQLPVAWAARANLRGVPPGKLSGSAPPLMFSEMHIWDNPTGSSVLELGISNNPFLVLTRLLSTRRSTAQRIQAQRFSITSSTFSFLRRAIVLTARPPHFSRKLAAPMLAQKTETDRAPMSIFLMTAFFCRRSRIFTPAN